MMKVSRTEAVALLLACGFKQAKKFDNAKAAAKLAMIHEVLPDEPLPDEAQRKLLKEVLEKKDGGFEVFDDETSKEPTDGDAQAGGAAAGEGGKPKAKRGSSKPKAEKTPSPYEHVRADSTNAHYIAGQMMKEFGLDKGVPDSMIAELKKRLGKDGKWDDLNLVHAWHSIRGYLGITEGAPVVPAKDETKPEGDAAANAEKAAAGAPSA